MATLPSFSGVPLAGKKDMIERMEVDLASQASAAFAEAEVQGFVFGVFSLDDLEKKLANEISASGKIGVGIAYHSASKLGMDSKPQQSAAPGMSSAATVIAYSFLLVLAVPSGEQCMERYNATQLLTVLRHWIHGSTVANDISSRKWNFQTEVPNTDQSTDTMLFYTQVWQVAIPLVGAKATNSN